MRTERKKLKRDVRGILRGAWPAAYLITLIYLLLVEGVGMAVGLATGDLWQQAAQLLDQGLDARRVIALVLSRTGPVGLFFNILLFFYTAAMEFGYHRWALNVARGAGEHKDLADGFGLASQVILLRVALALYAAMICTVAFIPALFLGILTGSRLGAALAVGVAAVAAGLRLLRYQLAPYCMMDDERHGVLRAMRRSVQLTSGKALEFLLLVLSFAGWLALPSLVSALAGGGLLVLTGGITALKTAAQTGEMPELFRVIASVSAWPVTAWVTPYMTVAICRYYDGLRAAEKTPEPQEAEV